jgi:hypothetical protein
MADEDCQLLCLSKENFSKVFFEEFRDIGKVLFNNTIKRRNRTVAAM